MSPSPSKRRLLSRAVPQNDDEDEEEDEETLQLKLQAIEAKLKLKALQKARKAAEGTDTDSNASSSRPPTSTSMRRVELPRPGADVQVPHSPIRKQRPAVEQKSPARVLLGIDKGLKAQDVSLKRPSISRSNSTRAEPPKIKSFSERLAEGKNREKQREETEAKIKMRRSRGFGLHNIEELKDKQASRSNSTPSSTTKTTLNMPPPLSRTSSKTQDRPTSDVRHPPTPRPNSTASLRSEGSRPPSSASKSSGFGNNSTAAKYAEISQRDDSSNAPSFESYSGLHLKSREMQHNVVTRTLENKTILTIPQMLKTVKAPEYDPPDWENDYVVLGVICSKSSPKDTKNNVRDQSTGNQERNQTGKFMVLRLTDLKYELDLFLFDTGFSQFWKLPVGTLIAILNPDIMPPRNRDTGKFSLKLSSSDDTILELGMSRDLGFCRAMKKDGKICEAWVDSRKTEYCEFHLQLEMEKSKRGRMEFNSVTGMGKGPGGGRFGMFGGGRGGGTNTGELKREGRYHDRGIHETVYIAPRAGGTATLLDRDEQSWEGGASREERFRRQLAAKEKEKELAQKLGKMGEGSAGAEYLKVKGASDTNLLAKGDAPSSASSSSQQQQALDTDFSSLLNRKAEDVSLGHAKRKRIASGKSTSSSEAIGWGGAGKRGLLLSPTKETPSALRGTRDPSPAKKKARLLLPEKGIREPGRDSIGVLDVGLLAAMDDDDDDLEIV